MKKTYKILFSAILMFAIITTSVIILAVNNGFQTTKAERQPKNYIVALEKSKKLDVKNKTIVEKGSSLYCYAYQPPATIEEIMEFGKNVIYGEVINVEYPILPPDNGNPVYKYDFLIEKSFKGGLIEGDKISVVEAGGYLPFKQYIDTRGIDKKNVTLDEMIEAGFKTTGDFENELFLDLPDGSPLAEVGDKFLLYIEDTKEDYYKDLGLEGVYINTSAKYRLVEIDDKFVFGDQIDFIQGENFNKAETFEKLDEISKSQ